MIWTAEDSGQLAKENTGAASSTIPIDHQGCNKRLLVDLILMLQWPGVICSNNAKSCYNCNVHAICALSMLRQKLPKSAIICVFTILYRISVIQSVRHMETLLIRMEDPFESYQSRMAQALCMAYGPSYQGRSQWHGNR